MRVALLVLLLVGSVAHASTAYQIAPTAIDFGPVDIRGLPATRTVTLTNTGTVALDLGAPTEIGAAAFTVTPLSATHLVAGASATATITYRPLAEHVDAATVMFSITGNPSLAVPVQGRGIDRHLAVTMPAVPDTFRNPGSKAPLVPVTVSNTGEANLAITSAAVTGAPVWQLVDDSPVDIPGGTSYDFRVRFAPTAPGPAPAGQLTLTSNDPQQPTVVVALSGTGLLRDVTMGPDLDLGYVGVGDVLASELSIVNLDSAHAFAVASVTSSDPAFAVTAPAQLDAGATAPLVLRFSAAEPGDHATIATLFLDEDPEAQDTVTLRAHAVYLDAQGGGGCSSGGEAGGGMVIVLAVLLVRRKRRALALVLVPFAAHADPPRDLDISIFDPTPSTVTGNFQLVTPGIGARGELVATALVTYAADPLVLVSAHAEDVAVANRATLVLGGAWAVADRIELGAHLPLFVQNGETIDPQVGAGTPGVAGAGHGNLTLHGKAQLAPALGVLAMLTIPTASDDRFAGETTTSARLLALTTFPIVPRVTATLNFGALLRSEARFASYTERSGVAWGAGAAFQVRAGLSVTGELFGELVPGGHRDAMGDAGLLATTELLVGAHDRLDPRFDVGVAIGRGVIAGPGAPAFRGIATVTFTPSLVRTVHVPAPVISAEPSHAAPVHVEPPHVVPPTAALDTDHDGIPDVRDACPTEPETINGIADDDGCPDKGDGLVVLTPGELALLAPVQFVGPAAIADASLNVLGQVGATLRAHPEIAHLRISAHVVPTANADEDLRISQRRAEAVRDWLVQWGIATSRLDAKGLGGTHPLVPADDPKAAELDNRVELTILGR